MFEETLNRATTDARARFYIALADFQSGAKQQALDQWVALMRGSAADAPWVPAVRQRIAEAATALGQDVAAVTPQPKPAAKTRPAKGVSGPTSDQVEAAQKMAPAERQDMVQAMVVRLAARLDDDPNNFDGWMRLIRSYAMLDKEDKAKEALATAMAQFKNAPFPTQKLTDLAKDLNLNGGEGHGRTNPGTGRRRQEHVDERPRRHDPINGGEVGGTTGIRTKRRRRMGAVGAILQCPETTRKSARRSGAGGKSGTGKDRYPDIVRPVGAPGEWRARHGGIACSPAEGAGSGAEHYRGLVVCRRCGG